MAQTKIGSLRIAAQTIKTEIKNALKISRRISWHYYC